MADHVDGKICKEEEEEAAVKPTRSFRYEDYSTRRVFLRSYPLQWDWSPSPEEKRQAGQAAADKNGSAGGSAGEEEEEEEEEDGVESCGRRWKRQVAEAVVGWGEEKLLGLFSRVKKRLALYLIGCSYGHRPALPCKSVIRFPNRPRVRPTASLLSVDDEFYGLQQGTMPPCSSAPKGAAPCGCRPGGGAAAELAGRGGAGAGQGTEALRSWLGREAPALVGGGGGGA
ncbi:hypothetical protein GUJ93_ZPchr0006g45351 [Zizania palustris]|uniref:Uncharacterized protein n=1 Tax=Zizania palustris TaxID=103762 RepID=A0A8J5W4I4_ZIZPA|nr:hypothetical protein GUJ93_ZPchr0006g45351 [Zizania palustris]